MSNDMARLLGPNRPNSRLAAMPRGIEGYPGRDRPDDLWLHLVSRDRKSADGISVRLIITWHEPAGLRDSWLRLLRGRGGQRLGFIHDINTKHFEGLIAGLGIVDSACRNLIGF